MPPLSLRSFMGESDSHLAVFYLDTVSKILAEFSLKQNVKIWTIASRNVKKFMTVVSKL